MSNNIPKLIQVASALRIALENERDARKGLAAHAADQLAREFSVVHGKVNLYTDAARKEDGFTVVEQLPKFRPNRCIDGRNGTKNGERARWAHGTLQHHVQGMADEADLRDLLSDLMHYAQREKVDFDAELAMARRRWEEER